MNIDFHSHILPGADHGSADLKTSLAQVDLAKQAGVDVLIATSHFYPRYENAKDFLAKREHAARQLLPALPEDSPRILLGAEVQICRGLHRLPELKQLCVENTNVLLLELPRNFSINRYEQTLDGLLYEAKLTVVLAHIDRYNASSVDLLLDMGLCAQINANAFHHWHSRKLAQHWVKDERIVALGSDLHGAKNGYEDFIALPKRLGADYRKVMARTQAVLGL